VGSSNMTGGGLADNVEANIVLMGTHDEIEEMGFADVFTAWKSTCFIPNEEYIDAYEFQRKRVVTASRKILAEPATVRALEELRQQERILAVKPRDPATLRGQKKWIYDRLPGDAFTDKDIYAHVKDFPTDPKSKTPKATMRRVLQELRDDGILIHLQKGLWKRRV